MVYGLHVATFKDQCKCFAENVVIIIDRPDGWSYELNECIMVQQVMQWTRLLKLLESVSCTVNAQKKMSPI